MSTEEKIIPTETEHLITMKVANNFNALSRIAGLFSGRGFNIDTLNIGDSEEPDMARGTITTTGDTRIVEQITRQLDKLVDVEEVTDLTYVPHVSRELALIKVNAPAETRSEIMQVANIFRAKIIDISPITLTIEITGNRHKVDAAIGMFRPFGLKEVARTGMIAIPREYQGEV
ncbi:MAG: acetolactate synthase small subunit [Balneolales bacterium]|nr:acetolactate synthase small subunit [Balneolales bacterium]